MKRVVAMAAAVLFALSGCSSGPDCPPGAQSGPAASAHAEPDYGFGLPKGARSINQTIWGDAYDKLQVGNCRDTRALIGPDGDWRTFGDMREVLLFQAAVELCNNKEPFLKRGADLYRKVKTTWPELGWKGIGWHGQTELNWHVCEVYRAVRSTVERVAKDSVSCEWGAEQILIADAAPDPRG